jgi:hypothetical protein
LPAVGGVAVSSTEIEQALRILRSSPGMMVAQPLRRAGNPLADCDYHAAAAPFRADPGTVPVKGRGAAGRHLTKPGFVIALESALAQAGEETRRRTELEAAVHELQAAVPVTDVEQALAAFGEDHSYAAAMAVAATGILRKRYLSELQATLRLASAAATGVCSGMAGMFRCAAAAPCGTGDCRLAQGKLAALAVSGPAPRQGSMKRPANHTAAGTSFSPDAMLSALEKLVPWDAAAMAGV